MIELTCSSCGKKLRAKAEFAGRMGKCPNCGQPIRVAADAADGVSLDDAGDEPQIRPADEQRLPVYHALERLNRQSHYLICDKSHLAALWENNGNGWMLNTGVGPVPVRRNRDKLPTTGTFQLVELKFSMTPDGKRLSGIASYLLGSRWALTALDKGDDAIVEQIDGPGCLNRNQKNAVRNTLKEQFMRPVWEDSAAVLDYLANADYQSPGVE